MHAGTVPVRITQWLAVPVDGQVILFSSSLKQVASNPDFVSSALGTLGEDLEFPLSCRNFCVDTFNIQTGLKAQVEMFFDQLSAKGILRTD